MYEAKRFSYKGSDSSEFFMTCHRVYGLFICVPYILSRGVRIKMAKQSLLHYCRWTRSHQCASDKLEMIKFPLVYFLFTRTTELQNALAAVVVE